MTTPIESASSAALAAALSQWLDRAGAQNPETAVDLADVVYAAKQIEVTVQSLMKLNPGDPAHAEMVMDELGKLHAWLFTEIKPHLAALESAWPSVESPVLALLPDEL